MIDRWSLRLERRIERKWMALMLESLHKIRYPAKLRVNCTNVIRSQWRSSNVWLNLRLENNIRFGTNQDFVWILGYPLNARDFRLTFPWWIAKSTPNRHLLLGSISLTLIFQRSCRYSNDRVWYNTLFYHIPKDDISIEASREYLLSYWGGKKRKISDIQDHFQKHQ